MCYIVVKAVYCSCHYDIIAYGLQQTHWIKNAFSSDLMNKYLMCMYFFLALVFKKNNFQFNGINYLQKVGTAMGTKVAHSFAITYMGDFEEKHVYTYKDQLLMYLRYINDIFII